jgi:thiamine pyrophosphate-dependent acetolactate synthase large subunit-like protein
MDRRKLIMLERRGVIAAVLRQRGEALVVAGLGSPAWDVFAAGDSPRNFYLWGGMGGAAALGLGLAIAQPKRRVLVITGDGEMLMGLGSLATIAAQRPPNLAVVVIDNEHYGETGMQPTPTHSGTDLAEVAQAAGFTHASTVRSPAQLSAWISRLYGERGPVFLVVKVKTDPVPLMLPPRDGPWLRSRFRAALLGDDAHE